MYFIFYVLSFNDKQHIYIFIYISSFPQKYRSRMTIKLYGTSFKWQSECKNV